MAQIPGAANVHKACSADDKAGTDWWVELGMGQYLSIDAKVREEDYTIKVPPRDDLGVVQK